MRVIVSNRQDLFLRLHVGDYDLVAIRTVF